MVKNSDKKNNTGKNSPEASDVIIYSPDFTLKEKLGAGVSLEKIFTNDLIEQTQKTITAMEPELLEELLKEIVLLEKVSATLKPNSVHALDGIIVPAFSIKSRAGFCHYPLISDLAKSLLLFCELIGNKEVLDKEIEVIICIVKAIRTVFDGKITGNGGKTGETIAAEVQQMVLKAAKKHQGV